MTFRRAVEACRVPLNAAYRGGKRALKHEHRQQLECVAPQRLTGSINVEEHLAGVPTPEGPERWDYGVGFKLAANGDEHAIWIEVHHASTGEVSDVLAKLRWLKAYLQANAGSLWAITLHNHDDLRAFHWLATAAGVHINANSPQARQLRAHGLDMPRRVLKLP